MNCGLRIADLCGFQSPFHVRVKQVRKSAIHNPQSALWPSACVRMRTETTKAQYGYYETETGRQEEHQEGLGSPGEGLKKRGGSNGDTIPES
jgi:hypothetical protein